MTQKNRPLVGEDAEGFFVGKYQAIPEARATQSLTALIERLLADEHILPAKQGLAKTVGDLSDFFNRLKKPMPTYGKENMYMSDPNLRAAYLAYFFPVNSVKTFLLLRRIASEGLLPQVALRTPATPMKILDFGCGPGTAALGAAYYLASTDAGSSGGLCDCDLDCTGGFDGKPLHPHPAAPELYLVDQSTTVLETAVRLLEKSELPLRIHASGRIPQQVTFDLILAFNVLNENTVDEARRIFALLKNHLSPTGRLLIAEPALRETARRLIELRDQLLSDTDVTLLWPCRHCANCPGILAENDWCHGTEVWERPDWIAQIDREIGNKKERLNYAALLYAAADGINGSARISASTSTSASTSGDSRSASTFGDNTGVSVSGKSTSASVSTASDTFWRVVSDPIIERGKRVLYLCGGSSGERIRTTALERHYSEANRGFFAAQRYDLLRIEGMLEKKGDGLRLSPETTAVLVRC